MSKLNFKPVSKENTEVWMDGLAPSIVLTEAIFLTVRQVRTPEKAAEFIKNFPPLGGQTTMDGQDAVTLASSLEIATKS
jgi:hypothetical protein